MLYFSILLHEFFFFLWLYSPILGLGRLHKTFRFISVTRSRTVSSTPGTGAPGDCDDDEVGGINFFLAGETEVLGEKPAPTSLCLPQIPLARPGREPVFIVGCRAALCIVVAFSCNIFRPERSSSDRSHTYLLQC
jgi:hypothetical protein